jgi:hypothetical protein
MGPSYAQLFKRAYPLRTSDGRQLKLVKGDVVGRDAELR